MRPSFPGAWCQRRRSRAISLVEVVFSSVLVAGLVVVALGAVGASAQAQGTVGDRARGQLLAAGLMSEILALEYSDPDGSPLWGVEALESTFNRLDFDDIDDYDGLAETPPKQRDGTAIEGFAGWTRSVEVRLVDPANLLQALATDQGLKRITVRVWRNGVAVGSVTAIQEGVPQTYGGTVPVDPDPEPWVKGLELQ